MQTEKCAKNTCRLKRSGLDGLLGLQGVRCVSGRGVWIPGVKRNSIPSSSTAVIFIVGLLTEQQAAL